MKQLYSRESDKEKRNNDSDLNQKYVPLLIGLIIIFLLDDIIRDTSIISYMKFN